MSKQVPTTSSSSEPLTATTNRWLIGFIVLSALMLAGALFAPVYHFARDTYVSLHTAMHVFSLVVAWLVFAVGWNTHDENRAGSVSLLACGFLAVALTDFGHALSYSGMPRFLTPASPEKAINFSLVSRALAGIALLGLAFSQWQPLRSRVTRQLYLGVTLVGVCLVYWLVLWHQEVLPTTYIAGQGLTPFKTNFEFVLAAIHALAAGGFWRKLRATRSTQWAYLFAASVMMSMSQFLNAIYFDPFDLHNFLSHVYRMISYALIYRGLFLSEIREPFERVARLQRELHESALRLRDMGAKVHADIEAERKRISQSLHDEMGQNLAVLRMDVDWIQRHAREDTVALEATDRMRERIEECAVAMRRVVADLRPRALDDLGIAVAARTLVRDVATRSGVQMAFNVEGDFSDVDEVMQTAMYRMLQEALTNITRHANASNAQVRMVRNGQGIVMSVYDDGVGFDMGRRAQPRSFGLFGMSERARQFGGICEVSSRIGKGTTIHIKLPVGVVAT